MKRSDPFDHEEDWKIRQIYMGESHLLGNFGDVIEFARYKLQ